MPDTQLPEEESSSDEGSTSVSEEDDPVSAENKASPKKGISTAAGLAKEAAAKRQEHPQHAPGKIFCFPPPSQTDEA